MKGQTIALEIRWAAGRYERVPELVAEMVRRKVGRCDSRFTPLPSVLLGPDGLNFPLIRLAKGMRPIEI